MATEILVMGSTGYFGKILVQSLLEQTSCNIIAVGRSPGRTKEAFGNLSKQFSLRLSTGIADLEHKETLEPLVRKVDIAICAAGPFQDLPFTLAELCLEHGVHYLDSADDRIYVTTLLDEAKKRKCPATFCTGWSAVPALSGLLIGIGSIDMGTIESIHIQIAPGNRAPRSSGTVGSLLSTLEQPFTVWRNGRWSEVQGWSHPRWHKFPEPIGSRRGYLVDVPDHELFPTLFGASTVEFRVGAELKVLNIGMTVLAGISRLLGTKWSNWAGPLSRLLTPLGFLGSDEGAFGVELQNKTHLKRVSVVAKRDGPHIAVLPIVMMVKQLISGNTVPSGPVPFNSWADRKTLEENCAEFGFNLIVEEEVLSGS